MRAGARVATLAAGLALAGTASASDAPPVAEPAARAWSFSLTAYPTRVRGGDAYTSFVAIANRGAFQLEARVDYEDVGARSAYVGWTFSGEAGDVAWEATPLVGGAWGSLRAFVPAVEASLSWRAFDLYVEAQYVRDNGDRDDSYFYAWSELGFKPVAWLRVGAASQRTRAYGGERDYQLGPLVQFSHGPVTVGAYWFNPGSREEVIVGAINLAF